MKILKIHLLYLLIGMTLGTTSFLHSAEGGVQFPNKKNFIKEFLHYQRAKDTFIEASNINPESVNDTFFSLVLSGDVRRIEIFFKNALDPDIFNEIGFTGLMMTTVHGNIDLLNLFLKAGACVNLTRKQNAPEDQVTALDLALNHYTYLTSESAPKEVLKLQKEKIIALKNHGAKTKEQLDAMRLEIEKRVQKAQDEASKSLLEKLFPQEKKTIEVAREGRLSIHVDEKDAALVKKALKKNSLNIQSFFNL